MDVNRDALLLDLIAEAPNVPWSDMVAFRNIVSHKYHRVDPALVWEAVLALGDIEAMVDAEQAGRNSKE